MRTPDHNAFSTLVEQTGILFGGDYNPEQWPRETWREDVELMQRAGVNLVSVGIFSWATIEPTPGAREFGWLDEVLDLLHAAGISVGLATPTASPPPWMGRLHPETLPVDRDGVRLSYGSRNQFTPSSHVYREYARAIARDLAERYGQHPAVKMWHIGNEFGQVDHGDEAAREFRIWLHEKYGTIEALNEAWGTAFWSQRYASFDEVIPPRTAPYIINPTQSVDFRHFSSDQLLRCYGEQYEVIRDAGATQPITTNFMGFFPLADYRAWAGAVDVVADDQYPDPADPNSPADIALVQDLMRSLGAGAPWMLMEQAISAVQWRPHNLPKTPAQARLNTLQAVARGADGICFFQWRQSRAGAERFHSAMLPLAGADSDVFAGVERQGAELQQLRSVAGGRIDAQVAVVFDWNSWWHASEPARPTTNLDTVAEISRWHRPLWRRGVAVDVVGPDADLTGYRAIVLPHSYVVTPETAAALRAAVEAGAHVVVGTFSGVADEGGHLLTGRSPVLLRDLLGVSGEEWGGLPEEPTRLRVTEAGEGAGLRLDEAPTATVLAEKLRAEGAEVLVEYDGAAANGLGGRPAVTRHRVGAGTAWYVGAVVDDALLGRVLGETLAEAGVEGALAQLAPAGSAAAELPSGLEAVRRGGALFLLNHGDETVHVEVPGVHVDLLTGHTCEGSVAVEPGDARVLSDSDERREL